MRALLQLATNPAIISMIAGYGAGLYNFAIPRAVSTFISYYLVFCIGLKGGMCLGTIHACGLPLIGLTCIGLLFGFIQPFFNIQILKKTTSLDRDTAIVIASQYGSISIVTFVTGITFLEQNGIFYDTYMTALAGMMEVPAIISGLLLLKSKKLNAGSRLSIIMQALSSIIRSLKISLLFIGFFIGFALRNYATSTLVLWTLFPFSFALILFMLDIGVSIAAQRAYIRQCSWQVTAFGIYMPITMGIIAVLIAKVLALSLGTTLLFAILLGSASYIAVPAIMDTHAPQAKKVIYLPLALAITLSFNLLLGIPLFYSVARILL